MAADVCVDADCENCCTRDAANTGRHSSFSLHLPRRRLYLSCMLCPPLCVVSRISAGDGVLHRHAQLRLRGGGEWLRLLPHLLTAANTTTRITISALKHHHYMHILYIHTLYFTPLYQLFYRMYQLVFAFVNQSALDEAINCLDRLPDDDAVFLPPSRNGKGSPPRHTDRQSK